MQMNNGRHKTTVITVEDMKQPDWQDRLANMKSFRFANDLLPVSVRFDSQGGGYFYWKLIKVVKGCRYSQHVGSSLDMNPDSLMICVGLLHNRIIEDGMLNV